MYIRKYAKRPVYDYSKEKTTINMQGAVKSDYRARRAYYLGRDKVRQVISVWIIVFLFIAYVFLLSGRA